MDFFFKELAKTNSFEDAIAYVKKVLLKRKLELNIVDGEYEKLKASFNEIIDLIAKEEVLCSIVSTKSVMEKTFDKE